MNKQNKKLILLISMPIIIIFLFIIGAIILYATFGVRNKTIDSKVYTDDYVINHYMNDFQNYENTQYERNIIVFKNAFGFEVIPGPHEPNYRGVINISKEQAKELFNEYDWEIVQDYEIENVSFYKLSYKPNMKETWYTSQNFKKCEFKNVGFEYVYFNGKDTIIYSIQTN